MFCLLFVNYLCGKFLAIFIQNVRITHVLLFLLIVSLQMLCSTDLVSIALNCEFIFSLIGMCVSKCVSVHCKSNKFPLSGLFAWSVPGTPPSPGLLYIARGAAGVVLVWLSGVVHLPNDLGEQFVYHSFALSRGLHERAAPLLG